MSDTPDPHWFPDPSERIDPMKAARAGVRADPPKRFYKAAAPLPTENGYVLALDGRPAHTPGKTPIAVRSEALAEAIAAEWNAQREFIDPTSMPLTRLVNTALDGVA